MNYELLKKGVCAFNAEGRDPSKCSCETGMPRPLPESPDTNEYEKAYFSAVDANYYSERSSTDIDALENFLLKYGMARVMPPPKKRKTLLEDSIRAVEHELRKIHDADLLQVDISALRTLACKIYSSINASMRTSRIRENATVVAKVMHILKPRLFVILDGKIRNARGINGSFDGYWSYLKTAQRGLREALEDYRRISGDSSATAASIEESLYEQGWKPITKLYDEACYAMVQGWLHFY